MSTSSILTLIGTPPLSPGNRASELDLWSKRCLNYRLADSGVQPARTTTYFYSTSGSNSNDGRDSLGLNLSTATYTASTRTLTKTNGFSGYTWKKNDLIYLSSGVTAGLYKIESKTNASNVVLSATADTLEGSLAAPSTDATGISSSTGPRQTIANLVSTLTASTGTRNMRFRLKCGDTWNEALGNVANVDSWTLDTYGTGAKPMLSYFADTITTGTWTNYSGNGWSHAAVSGVTQANLAWIREKYNRLRAYKRIDQQGSDAANKALVATTNWSFCIDASNVIYVNHGGYDPNTSDAGGQIAFEVAKITSTTPGLWVNTCDNVLIKNIAFHGWNMNFSSAAYAVLIDTKDYRQVVLDGVEAFYTGYHPIGTTASGTNNNHVITLVNCKAGYACPWSGGETMINLYNSGSGAEHIVANCEVPFGSLPWDGWSTSTTSPTVGRGQAFYGHTNGGTHALQLFINNKVGTGGLFPYAPDTPILLSNLPSVTTRSDVRGIVIGHECIGYPVIVDATITPDSMMMVNCRYEVTPIFKNNGGVGSAYSSGYALNCMYTVDATRQFGNSTTSVYQYALGWTQQTVSPKFDFCDLRMLNLWNKSGLGPPDYGVITGKLWKSILSTTTVLYDSPTQTTNSASFLNANVYCGRWDASTYSADTLGITLPGPLSGLPHKGWEGEGISDRLCHDGFINDVDFFGNVRPVSASAGAFETNPANDITAGETMKESYTTSAAVTLSADTANTVLACTPTKSPGSVSIAVTNDAASNTAIKLKITGKLSANGATVTLWQQTDTTDSAYLKRLATPQSGGTTNQIAANSTFETALQFLVPVYSFTITADKITSGQTASVTSASINL